MPQYGTMSRLHVSAKKKKGQWRLHNCGNTPEATTLLQQFIKKKTAFRMVTRSENSFTELVDLDHPEAG